MSPTHRSRFICVGSAARDDGRRKSLVHFCWVLCWSAFGSGVERVARAGSCKRMTLHYHADRTLTDAEFIDALQRSTLAERRPVDDPRCIRAMLEHADLLCTAWDGDKLIGVARSVTDFEYCCYLSDLAVDVAYQKQGVGRELVRRTKDRLGPKAKLILLAAPKAEGYYPKIGFQHHRSAWWM